MKSVSRFRNVAIFLLLFLPSLACNFLSAQSPTEPSQQPDLRSTSTPQAELPKATNFPVATTESPVATQENTQNPDTTRTDPSCTVLQDLNFRSGPGEAYTIMDVLPANQILIPLGYNPAGVPGGRWVYAKNAANGKEGWVGAGARYISCNIDPASLPVIVVDVPPTNTPRVVAALPSSVLGAPSEGGGTCGPQPDYTFDCSVTLTKDGFVQFFLYQNGRELTANDGVQQVDFFVFNSDKSRVIYSHTESNSPYCIFGGDSACSPWVFEDGVYKWSSGGEVVQNGTYVISITPSVVTGDPIHWEYFVDVFLPD